MNTHISSVSRSISGCTSATWSLQQMTLPSADKRSSMRWILTLSGIELRRCWSSWSVVVVGTRRPLRFLRRGVSQRQMPPRLGFWKARERENVPGRQAAYYPGAGNRGVTYWDDVLEFGFEYTARREFSAALRSSRACRNGARCTCKNSQRHRRRRVRMNL